MAEQSSDAEALLTLEQIVERMQGEMHRCARGGTSRDDYAVDRVQWVNRIHRATS